jgi:hypothetical protein
MKASSEGVVGTPPGTVKQRHCAIGIFVHPDGGYDEVPTMPLFRDVRSGD